MREQKQVVMLPSDEASNLVLAIDNPLGLFWNASKMRNGFARTQNQHLYVTDDSEIKKGDWFVKDGRVRQCEGFDEEKLFIHTGNVAVAKYMCRKVIATTNPALWPEIGVKRTKSQSEPLIYKIPQSFIQVYIEAHNAGKPITDIMVEVDIVPVISDEEYEQTERQELDYRDTNPFEISLIKLRADGTIVVHPVVERKFTEADMISFAKTIRPNTFSNAYEKEFDEWLSDHYPNKSE